jgi:hypothetical protein
LFLFSSRRFFYLIVLFRFREFHVSYRKTSLGDSGGDSGSEQGSVVIRRPSPTLGPLSPPHIFHPEDNPLPALTQE